MNFSYKNAYYKKNQAIRIINIKNPTNKGKDKYWNLNQKI